jgi:magnesium transporter
MSTTILTHGRVTWTNIVHPTAEDIQQLSARYPQFHPLNLQDCMTELEYPKFDHHDDYLFLVVQMPVWDARERVSRPAEVDIFVARGTLVTSHRGELEPLVELFERAQADETFRAGLMGQGASQVLYPVLNALVDRCFPTVRRVYENLRRIEDNLFHNNMRHILHEVAFVRRDVITLRSILKSQTPVVGALVDGSWPFIHAEMDPYWGDVRDHLLQLSAMLDEYCEVVGGLSDTVDTLASHRIDEVVRLLTVVTVLTLPLTLLATIFGMNILMPYAEHPLLFYTVIGLGVAFTAGLLWYLRRNNWL